MKYLSLIIITVSDSFSSFSFCPQPYSKTERCTRSVLSFYFFSPLEKRLKLSAEEYFVSFF